MRLPVLHPQPLVSPHMDEGIYLYGTLIKR